MQNITLLTLGELLTHKSETIRRLAGSILKLLQRADHIHSYKSGDVLKDWQGKGGYKCTGCDHIKSF